ncbi:RTA1 like protein-domain-containing protein [Auriculariales sp. MPI-PUGE-AT-0066]|nr:RTA1 like protein-domain-containing protein [Auriculariales sp. MPI-PUGE-AT-0066]
MFDNPSDPDYNPIKAAGFKFFHYDPSGPAAIVFKIMFLLSTLMGIVQMSRTRTWYLTPFLVGGALSTAGYVARYICSTQTPDWTLGPYLIQSLFLLVAPALFAASIYMELKRIIIVAQGEQLSPIPFRWLTKLFVGGDILSFLLQGGGGGLVAQKDQDKIKMGQNLIVGGLFVQLTFFAAFTLTAVLFQVRVRRHPTSVSQLRDLVPWRKHIYALYFMSILIFIRSVFRVIEYLQGYTGYLLVHEIYLYVFDSILMLFVCITMNVVHPSELDGLAFGGLVSRRGGLRYEVVQPINACWHTGR